MSQFPLIAPLAVLSTLAGTAAADVYQAPADYTDANKTFSRSVTSSASMGIWSALYQNVEGWNARSLTLSTSSAALSAGDGLALTVTDDFGFSALGLYNHQDRYGEVQMEGVTAELSDTDVTLSVGASQVDAGLFGVYVESRALHGITPSEQNANGNASQAGAQDITLTRANVSVTAAAGASHSGGGGALVLNQREEPGGDGQEDYPSGNGSGAQDVNLGIEDSTIAADAEATAGILVRQKGGAGGNGKEGESRVAGGSGGSMGKVALRFTQGDGGPGSTVSTTGGSAPGISVTSQAGTGGNGAYDGGAFSISPDAGAGGTGGTGGNLNLQNSGALSVTTQGDSSVGMSLVSTGGTGGDGGDVDDLSSGHPGAAGAGGNGGSVSFTLLAGLDVGTQGEESHGIVARTTGGQGGGGGGEQTDISDAETPDGGKGGTGGNISIDTRTGTRIATVGASADGILAQSIGGTGGDSSFASGGLGEAHAGAGGEGGASGTITVYTTGEVTTSGLESRGVLAQGIGGLGGNGADASGLITSEGGTGAKGGGVGAINVTQNAAGRITTTGENSQGILAQSIAGGGGAGGRGDYALFGSSGGDGVPATDAGRVDVYNFGSIVTEGESSFAIVAQSVGGGGGIGGTGSGVFASDGGDGGAGGGGGHVTAELNGSYDAGAKVQTSGKLAHGLVLQSVGGGGGAGGNSQDGGVGEALAIGGDGGDGGAGGRATAMLTAIGVTTSGGGANGVVVQSVGGGGGVGGAAIATSGGVAFSEAAAIGGSGGNGGAGHTAEVTLDGGSRVATTGSSAEDIDSHGLLVQSIGGGGGSGGGASAFALAASIPFGSEAGAQSTPTFTIDAAIGGSGGNGGAALASDDSSDSASATVKGGSSVETEGAGSQAVLIQSIGGGGGNGGDSSAAYASVGFGAKRIPGTPAPNNMNFSLAVGGNCSSASGDETCGGGAGGSAAFSLGDADTATSRISTLGNLANAVVVQSIGGGGGNAGVGSTSSSTYFSGAKTQMQMTLGSQGGTGGTGQAARATTQANGLIETAGANSRGLVVQSIGGGGGIASGSGVTLIGGLDKKINTPVTEDRSIDNSIKSDLSLKVGAIGGTGGNAGTVTVDHAGTIVTAGAGSTGILAQSIGGGGGIGGAAGASDAPSDEEAEDFLDIFNEIYDQTVAGSSSALVLAETDGGSTATKGGNLQIGATLMVGGTGGSGGTGGTVDVTQQGTIVTQGDLAYGLKAQSIGGGGGTGGTAVAEADPNTLRSFFKSWTVKADFTLGFTGAGGAGSNGGTVEIGLGSGTIVTGQEGEAGGFGAIGILAQSIGGGGGTGGDNSVLPGGETADEQDPDNDYAPPSLVLGANLTSVSANGSAGNGGSVSLSSADTLSGTQTVLTQGGQAHAVALQSVGGGGGLMARGGSVDVENEDNDINPSARVQMGNQSLSSGNGGAIDTTGLTADTPLALYTTGTGSFGLLAQSIGGGGGLLSASNGHILTALHLGGSGGGDGGTVDVALPEGSTIATTGKAGHGIVAQSVGGGGGIVTTYFAKADKVSDILDQYGYSSGGGEGMGKAVTVTTAADISVAGDGAFGILAQSVGGGGGIAAYRNGSLFLGTTGTAGGETGSGGIVTVTTTGDIAATGTSSAGIVAQSAGPTGTGNVLVTVGSADDPASVTGGAGEDGVGILVLDGSSTNVLTVNAGSSVTALSGQAIRQTGGGVLNVTNQGSIAGSASLGGGTITGNPATSAAAVAPAAAAGTLTNAGTLVALPGSPTVIDGHLVQTGSGILAPVVDFAAGQAGSFAITGDATLDGTVVPRLAGIIPQMAVPVLSVEGSTTGTLQAGGTALFDFSLEPQDGVQMLSVAGRDFDRAEFGLSGSSAAAARELETLFDQGDTGYSAFFAELDQTAAADAAAFGTAMSELGPRSAMTLLSQRAAEATDIADAAMSCPVFETGSFLAEGSCVYGRFTASRTDRDAAADAGSADFDDHGLQLGGQTEISPDLFLGGVIGYRDTSMDGSDGVSAEGHAVSAALTLKYQTGPWLFAGAVFGSRAEDDLSRRAALGSFGGTGEGTADSSSWGMRLRAAYTVGSEAGYLRPSLTLDGLRAETGSFSEDGLGALGLDYDKSTYKTAILTPAVEIGARSELRQGMILRSYVSGGVALRSNDDWSGEAHLQGAPGGSGIDAELPLDDAAFRLRAGVQLFDSGRMDLRAEYGGSFGSETVTHAGSLTLSYRF
ncbi:autotransporter outer membrane beta-barrel domain-containing protein [Poseidonocella sp. HB161398]|uniref:autotransporter outer membrane beta-barrel domain-containing protein n=1 Tax=Poseidonocella sp. HB161398 TaxID=2320855 RepID=UPI001109D8A9|nr:autotransporter outer membrane beta-barrel domain-containing protein [Poseidonocella sp. HB161398]